jgi:hypothetical protein
MARTAHPNFSRLSTFYADESDNKAYYVIACLNIPTIHARLYGVLGTNVEWQGYYDQLVEWRRKLKATFNVPIKKEIKGSKIATGRNRYDGGSAPIYGMKAFKLYEYALRNLDFLPASSVFSVSAPKGYVLYGHTRLEATLYAMFQRMEMQCASKSHVAILFFDEGHAEYRKLFRKACVYLPTGSNRGDWGDGAATKNKPFSRAIKDLNFKDSRQSGFIQIADLIAYATLLKMKKESGTLSDREKNLGFGDIHDCIPRHILNAMVDNRSSDGIKRLK